MTAVILRAVDPARSPLEDMLPALALREVARSLADSHRDVRALASTCRFARSNAWTAFRGGDLTIDLGRTPACARPASLTTQLARMNAARVCVRVAWREPTGSSRRPPHDADATLTRLTHALNALRAVPTAARETLAIRIDSDRPYTSVTSAIATIAHVLHDERWATLRRLRVGFDVALDESMTDSLTAVPWGTPTETEGPFVTPKPIKWCAFPPALRELRVLAPWLMWAEVHLDGAALARLPLLDTLVVDGRGLRVWWPTQHHPAHPHHPAPPTASSTPTAFPALRSLAVRLPCAEGLRHATLGVLERGTGVRACVVDAYGSGPAALRESIRRDVVAALGARHPECGAVDVLAAPQGSNAFAR